MRGGVGMSIKVKLTIIILSLIAIPLFFVSAITFSNYRNSLMTSRLSQLQNLARFKAEEIEAYFEGLKNTMEMSQGFYNIRKHLPVLARSYKDPHNREAGAAKKALDGQLVRMQKALDLADIMLADISGTIVYVSNPEHNSKDFSRSLDEISPESLKQGTKSIYFSDIFINRLVENRPEILACAPVIDLDGAPAGIIAVEIDMAPLYRLIQDTMGLGTTGEILIGKKSGNDIVFLNPLRHDPEAALKRRVHRGDKIGLPLQNAVSGKTGIGQSIDYRGKKVVAAWTHISFPDWGLVAKIDIREEFAIVTNLLRLLLLVVAVVFVMACIITFSVAQSISVPIQKLTKGAEIIGSGNLDFKVGMNLHDEIGRLSRSFDKMTDNLKTTTASRDELNKEISVRNQAENALRASRAAALNLMEDAVEARKQAEKANIESTHVAEELRKVNRTLKALSASSQAMMRASEEADFLREVCRIVQEDCGHAMVWIGFAENDEEKSIQPSAYAGFEAGYLATLRLSWADTERGRGPTGTAIRTGKVTECKNMLTDPAFAPWREEALRRGYASSVALPLFTMAGDRAFGAITIYAKEPDAFSREEVALLSELASDLAFGIMTIRLFQANARAEEAVRESEARYRSLFGSMTEGFALHEIICDEKGEPVDYRFLDVNPAFERLTGLARKEAVGKTKSEIPQLQAENPKWIALYGRVALTGEPVHAEDYSSARKTHYSVFVYQPAPMQFAAIFTDATEQVESRKKIEELNTFLKRRAAELSTSYSELETVTQLLSQDIQTPLHAVNGYTDLLLNEYGDKIDRTGKNYLTLLDTGVHRINLLLDNILLLSNISRKQMWLQRVDLSACAQQVVDDLRKTQPDRKVEVRIQENLQEWADQGFMKQVLHNLIENSWKFTSRRERPTIEFGVLHDKEHLVYFVRDNGTGFDVKEIDRLFSPFQTVQGKNDFEGKGVGLAVVHRIIQRHGGKVWAESEKGKGAVFYFKLG